MTTFKYLTNTAILCLMFSLQAVGQAQPRVFYVAPTGDDSWSGLLATSNRNLTDGPFATFTRVRDAIRELKQREGLPAGGVTVRVRGGLYRLSRSLSLSTEDSGTKNAPLVWEAYTGEEVVLTGGKDIGGFHPVTDPSVLNRIDPNYRKKIVVTDLKAQGIDQYGEISQRGSAGMELFFKGARMALARWPNKEWLLIADVPQTGTKRFNEGLEREKRFNNVPVGRHYGRITYDGDRPKRWSSENEIYLHGYWTWDWSDAFQKVKSIDTISSEITLQEPHHHYGYTKNQRYYFLNILEELDSPGEWYIDRKHGLLYFWPPDAMTEGSSSVSMLEEPIVSLDSTSFITLARFTFEQGRSSGVVVKGGSHNLIAGCTLRFLGNEAVTIDGGTENGVQSCDLYNLSLAAIRLKGGDRRTLVPGNNFAVNNHIHHYSSWVRTGQYAVFVDGVGAKVQHNVIHDAPFEAIYLRGNDHLIEFNEVYRVCQESGDAGALHTGRDWTWRGNVIRYNYFHHLLGPGLHGVMAVYLDDWASGFTVYGNVFYKSGRSAMIGGGRDNTVENNIFIECAPSVHLDARGLSWAGYFFNGTQPLLFEELRSMKYQEPPYSTRYPELLTLDKGNPAFPLNNKVIRNISYGGRWIDFYDSNAFDFSVVTMRDNLIADTAICRRQQKDQKGWDTYYLDIDRKDGYVLYTSADQGIKEEFRQNTFITGDPGFENLARNDFRLKSSSRAFALGFKPLPIDKIGLYKDSFRRIVPDRP
ncbi:MAG: right-handed parallel beta-helix repeat-containing protein [Ignavibacteriales bacterium]|nr:right-handed parallel beta-helix repeat-containing protein [Ignavibacteriales bacterium]